MERQISRRDFCTTLAAGAGLLIANGCGGFERGERLPAAGGTTLPGQLAINGPAEVNTYAERGGQIQVTDTAPPPFRQTWESGQFVTHALLDFAGVALNYDDGPSPYDTNPILRVLAKYGIKATFYIVGVNARAWPEIVIRIQNDGHEIGNHSVYHDPYTAQSLASQIWPNQQIIYDITKKYPVSNRMPGLTRGQIALDTCRQYGLYEMHTTIDSGDWRDPRIQELKIYQNVIGGMHWGGAPLQHDGGNKRPTPDAQEAIIIELLRQGYQFSTVTDMINHGKPAPGTFTYTNGAYQGSPDVAQSVDKELAPVININCNYDPTKELEQRLDDPHIKVAERSRIVEVLADIEQHQKAA